MSLSLSLSFSLFLSIFPPLLLLALLPFSRTARERKRRERGLRARYECRIDRFVTQAGRHVETRKMVDIYKSVGCGMFISVCVSLSLSFSLFLSLSFSKSFPPSPSSPFSPFSRATRTRHTVCDPDTQAGTRKRFDIYKKDWTSKIQLCEVCVFKM